MKIKKITIKKHSETIPVYCLNEPINNEILIVGKSGKEYASYQTTNLAFSFCQSPFSFQNKIREEWSEEQIDYYINNNQVEKIIDKNSGKINKYFTIATDINNRFFIKYPRIKEYANYIQNFAKKNGYVSCPIYPGVIRHLPELLKQGSNMSRERLSYYSTLNNIAVNAGAQGGEAVTIYKALIKIYNKINQLNLKSKLIGCVHDSIVLYIHKSEVEQMYHILKESMEVFDYSIPILAEIEFGSIWGFGEEVTEKNIDQF